VVLRDGELKHTVLVFVNDGPRLLMIFKKRGQGAGKINVPGGKLHQGESPLAAAARETREETGLTPMGLKEAGRLEFSFPENDNWDNHCTVFTASGFSGTLVAENEECTAYWESRDKIPLEKMWDADRLWLPHLLHGEWFHRSYVFDAHDKVKSETDLAR
jgi:8-oxo-dGTP diphosphatase